jgi:hypothetical protein
MKTYLNKSKVPIIRKCDNCIYYLSIDNLDKIGYCKFINLMFAFTHEKSVYGMVKNFYLCTNHVFRNEEILKLESEEVMLLPYLIERNLSKNLDPQQ